MDKGLIKAIIADQLTIHKSPDRYVEREMDLEKAFKGKEIVVISGIRRCGKSTLLKMTSNELDRGQVFIDFSDIRFTGFSEKDFPLLDECIHESLGEVSTYLLDEIQNVPSWQRWVRTLFTNGKKVYLTGSNSGILGSDIATLLTGRNRVIKLFPFSFREYLRLKGITLSDPGRSTSMEKAKLFNAFEDYRSKGGFPEVLLQDDVGMARIYFEDIITKDIIARYGTKDPRAIREMAMFLVSNTGRQVSYQTLAKMVGIKSVSTIKRYLDHLEESYLFRRVNRFSYSVKKQVAVPAKYYAADVGFLTSIAFRTSANRGHHLENIVFNHLDRSGMEIYYHHERKECDFILKDGPSIVQAIQVSDDLTNGPTRDREISGLVEALDEYGLEEGTIITLDHSEVFEEGGHWIRILPAWRWMMDQNSDPSSSSI
jgi:predicted AAA+ superfamily ATPase